MIVLKTKPEHYLEGRGTVVNPPKEETELYVLRIILQ